MMQNDPQASETPPLEEALICSRSRTWLILFSGECFIQVGVRQQGLRILRLM